MPQTNTAAEAVQTVRVEKDLFIAATPDIVWESILEEIGGEMNPESGKAMVMKIETWPGGRWWRDTGDKQGHLWGHVQVIKPPMLLELCGPMFMSYPAINHLQYRLAAERDGTRMKLTHRGIGIFDAEHLKGVEMGWGGIAESIRKRAEQRANR
jgi:hypothetical protein